VIIKLLDVIEGRIAVVEKQPSEALLFYFAGGGGFSRWVLAPQCPAVLTHLYPRFGDYNVFVSNDLTF